MITEIEALKQLHSPKMYRIGPPFVTLPRKHWIEQKEDGKGKYCLQRVTGTSGLGMNLIVHSEILITGSFSECYNFFKLSELQKLSNDPKLKTN